MIEEMEGKLKMATSHLEQLQAEHARVMSEVTASPCNTNRLSPAVQGSLEEARSLSEDRIVDSIVEGAASVYPSEDIKPPEDKKTQNPETSTESQHPVSEKLINLEKEVCICVYVFYIYSNNNFYLISAMSKLYKYYEINWITNLLACAILLIRLLCL